MQVTKVFTKRIMCVTKSCNNRNDLSYKCYELRKNVTNYVTNDVTFCGNVTIVRGILNKHRFSLVRDLFLKRSRAPPR